MGKGICFVSVFFFIFFAGGVFFSANAWAVSAYPHAVETAQPDGVKFMVQRRGDEFYSWDETDEGYPVVLDSGDGFWKYARPVSGRLALEAMPDARVGRVRPEVVGARRGYLPDRISIKRRVEGQLEERRALRGRDARSVPGVPAAAQSGEDSETPPPAAIPVSGTTSVKNIVILACFNDHWDTTGGTVLSSKGRVNTTEYTNLFNETGHSGDGAVGSVKDYYQEVSYGKMTVNSVVTSWVRLPQIESYYGADGASTDTNWQVMVADAINAADTAGFDFSQGDSDGDGWVDCLTVIHSGHGQEYSGNPTTCIWSSQWELTSPVTKDGVKMKSAHTEPALRGLTTSTSITRIGVVCHEMGHFFGLPDLYDYSSTTYGLGYWGLMASGSWNGSDGKRPAHFCAWSKYMLGFVKPQQIHSLGTVSIANVEANPVVHMFRDGMANDEYFLVENRSKTGFDNDPAIYPGILIYHIDAKSANNDLGTWAHPAVKMEEADGDNSLGGKTARSESGDAWTSTNGLAGGFRDQSGNQSTNAMMYQAAHYYNRTDSSASYSRVRLNTFSAAQSTMTYSVSTVKPTVSSQSVTTPGYTVNWGTCTNATKYEIQEGTAVTLTSFSDGAENEDAMYENWNLSGTVRRDNGGARTGSYSYAMHRYYGGKWYSSVQALSMRKPFKVLSGTTVSFYLISHLGSGNGYMKCQISNDSGNTWKTLGTYSGYIDPWSLRSYNYASMNAVGINLNDQCILRFVANFEHTSGWSAFPGYGYAVDDISITGTEIPSYGNWVSLNNNVVTNSYAITGKTSGVYAYQVQAYCDSAWRGFGELGTTTVVLPFAVNFQTDGTPGASLTGTTAQSIAPGGNCTPVTAVVPANYDFVNWTGTGGFVSAANPVTVTNVTQDMTITANYARHVGSVTAGLLPPAAVSAGAQWRLTTGPDTAWKNSGDTISNVPTGGYTAEFKTIAGWDAPVSQGVLVSKNLTTPITGTYVRHVGSVTVTLSPAGAVSAGAQWRLTTGPDTAWKASGDTVSSLPTGDYTVEFSTIGDWDTPVSQTVTVAKDATASATGTYVRHVGSVTVTISPAGAVLAGAQWRLTTGPDTAWKASGDTVSSVPTGDYTVEFSTIGDWDTPVSQTVTVAKDATVSATGTYVRHVGLVTVTISPAGAVSAGAQWRLTSGPDTAWKASGDTVSSLPTGDYTVEFNAISDWDSPVSQTVTVTKDATASVTGAYVRHVGSVTVTISPAGAVLAGAQWRLNTGPDTAWKDSDDTVSALPTGDYTVEFSTISDWDAPVSQTVTVTKDATASTTGTYVRHVGSVTVTISPAGAVLAGAQWRLNTGPDTAWKASGDTVSSLPTGDYTVEFNTISDWDSPVSQTVTVAKDATASVTGTYVRHVGSVTVTLSPAGAVLAGAQWRLTSGPDTAWKASGDTVSSLPTGDYTVEFNAISDWDSPVSQTVTVTKDATASATGTYVRHVGLVTVTISPAGAVSAGAQWRLTTGPDTAWKASGDTVSSLPTGDYTVEFNAISDWDSPVSQTVTVTKDATASATGTYVRHLGSVTVTLSPAGAVSAGAQWRLTTGPDTAWKASGDTVSSLPTGNYTVEFSTIGDWDTPASQTVTVTKDATASMTGTYVRHVGSVTVTISPAGAVSAGAQWRLTSGPDTAWKASGDTVSSLPTGDYTVEFGAAPNWNAPSFRSVTVTKDATTSEIGNYVIIDGDAPTAVLTLESPVETGADQIVFSVVFSEAVIPMLAPEHVALTGTLSASVAITGSGPDYTVTISPDMPDEDGTVEFAIAGGVLADAAGNPFAGADSPECHVLNWHGFAETPASARLYTGDSHLLRVTPDCDATGLAYQWKQDDGTKAVHDGPATPAWTIAGAAPSDQGTYWCEVSYDGQTYSSAPAVLEVADHLAILAHPEGGEKAAGQSHDFLVTAAGGYPPLSYQWKKDGEVIASAPDAPGFTLDNISTADAGGYTVEVSDANAESLESHEALLAVNTTQMPVMAWPGLAVLALVLAAAGRKAERRGR